MTSASGGNSGSDGKRLIVIGASAGGIAAMSHILSRLPASLGAPILFVMHLPAQRRSQLTAILGRGARMPAVDATDRAQLLTDTLYVAPPGRQLSIVDGAVRLDLDPGVDFFTPSIDRVFSSSAESFGEGLVAVQLTGRLSDGARGLMDVRRRGGRTIVQDPAEAAYSSMPHEAIRSGGADFVLPLDAIADKLADLLGVNRLEIQSIR